MKTLGLTSFAVTLIIAFAAQGGDDAAKKEKAALQGEWKIVEFETPDGKNNDLVGAMLDFGKDGKALTFTHNNDTKKGTFKINPAGKPKEIDITPSEDNNKTLEGIYRIEKTTLKICLSTGNDGRPNEFAINGKKYVLITLEKAK